ncbi:hypothetical protein WICPIJ_006896 [Wickerhamomyces pijperi]|uniref:Nuclear segregation protein BFR1 n=1 Tax=Wickerhamomyces pijperi TaxID=599730 RepID=A0A9P8Q0W1_WICPI|nr:hypothetical protein WICPIJ_006896 [Wickerhamomyces pijperi]
MSSAYDREDREERDEFRVQKRFIKGPDTKARDEKLGQLNAQLKQKDQQLTEVNALINKNVTDPKVQAQRKELIAELGELKKTQGDLKGKREVINAKVKEIDGQLKRKIAEISSITSKHSFKTVADIDAKIAKSEDLISSGELSLVEERRLVKEISSLRKVRKDFGSLEVQQKSIDNDKAKIAELKQELTGLNSREVSAKFDAIQKQLDELTLSNKSVNEKRNSLFDRRTAIHGEKDVIYKEIRAVRAAYDDQYKKFKQAMAEEKKRVIDEEKNLRQAKAKSERKSKLEKELAEASQPAFEYEIETIHTLLHYFDPSYVKPVKSISFNSGSLVNERKGRVIEQVSADEIISKENFDFIQGSNNRSKKGGKKQHAKKFTLEPDVIASLGDLQINLPVSKEDTASTFAELKTKLDAYVNSQEEVTKKNVEIAQAKIAKMEAQWAKEDAEEAAKLAAEEATEEADEE